MRRPAHGQDTLKRIQRWRAECPDLVLRSTFIVGFPGETEAEFENCCSGSTKRSSIAWLLQVFPCRRRGGQCTSRQ